jgi:ubiquitin carboxyl-terminal hydrolase 5/13
MGFTDSQAKKALKSCDNNLERAIDYLFSRADQEACDEEKKESGSPVYDLKAIVCHRGGSTHSGHYVCYIKKEGQWYLYNDEKVVLVGNYEKGGDDIGMGYLYFYENNKK